MTPEESYRFHKTHGETATYAEDKPRNIPLRIAVTLLTVIAGGFTAIWLVDRLFQWLGAP